MNATATPSRIFPIERAWQGRRGFPLRGDKRDLPASRGVFFPGQERCRPGDVTVRLQWLLQPGAIQTGIGKNPGKSLNKLNTANEMTDQKDGERGGSHLLFQGSVNTDPAALMANKGRDALPVQERQGPCGHTLSLPQVLWKRGRHRAVPFARSCPSAGDSSG